MTLRLAVMLTWRSFFCAWKDKNIDQLIQVDGTRIARVGPEWDNLQGALYQSAENAIMYD